MYLSCCCCCWNGRQDPRQCGGEGETGVKCGCAWWQRQETATLARTKLVTETRVQLVSCTFLLLNSPRQLNRDHAFPTVVSRMSTPPPLTTATTNTNGYQVPAPTPAAQYLFITRTRQHSHLLRNHNHQDFEQDFSTVQKVLA